MFCFIQPQSLNSLVMRENELRNRYEVLEKEKHDRLSESNKLTDEDRQLCKRMNVSPLKVKLDAVPKSDQLMKFKALVEERKQEVVLCFYRLIFPLEYLSNYI